VYVHLCNKLKLQMRINFLRNIQRIVEDTVTTNCKQKLRALTMTRYFIQVHKCHEAYPSSDTRPTCPVTQGLLVQCRAANRNMSVANPARTALVRPTCIHPTDPTGQGLQTRTTVSCVRASCVCVWAYEVACLRACVPVCLRGARVR
jgi:hypothetical protein